MRKRLVLGPFGATTRRNAAPMLGSLACTLGLCLSANAQDRQPTIITFNAPDAGTVSSPACAPDCGTLAYAVNDRGEIVGWYTDTNIVPHGFLRSRDGRITSFEAPGAGLGYGLDQGTVATSINDWGAIAGQFQDSSYVFHGFVRYPDGAFTTFDAPGAGTGAFQGTMGEGINPAGEIVGVYIDANNASHGFLRRLDGAITNFDDPDAGTGPDQGTVTGEKSINPDGEIDGWFTDQDNVTHGFARAADGSFTTIDPPGAQVTIAGGINPTGVITGYYADASGVYHGFLRARDGTFTTFEAPGAVVGTAAFSLNLEQAITGIYIDGSNVMHGFLRHPRGAFTTFDAPGAGNLAGGGTRPEFIDAAGTIIGFYFDENGVSHGFLRLPDRR
jgi:hypothetical protein